MKIPKDKLSAFQELDLGDRFCLTTKFELPGADRAEGHPPPVDDSTLHVSAGQSIYVKNSPVAYRTSGTHMAYFVEPLTPVVTEDALSEIAASGEAEGEAACG